MKKTVRLALFAAVLLVVAVSAAAQESEVEGWPEFDIWIRMNDTTQIYVLLSAATDLDASYQERVAGISVDKRMSPSWGWRLGVRYIHTGLDSGFNFEWRGVADLKYYKPFGDGWRFSNRARIDFRQANGKSSERYRDRVMLEKTFNIKEIPITWFGSYETYYYTEFNKINRDRIVVGFSGRFTDLISCDLFYGHHWEKLPKSESRGAFGFALGIYF